MEHTDKNFFIALAYTAAHEKDLDLPAFSQKVQENLALLKKIDEQKPLPKAKIGNRSELGI